MNKYIASKNSIEKSQYNSFIKEYKENTEDTVHIQNPNLDASDSMAVDDDHVDSNNNRVIRPSIVKRIKQKLSDNPYNPYKTLLITIITGLLGWGLLQIHNNAVEISAIKVKIEYMQNDIDKFYDKNQTYYDLVKEIDSIKNEVNNRIILDISDLKLKLNDLEHRIRNFVH